MGLACLQLSVFALTKKQNLFNAQLMRMQDDQNAVTDRLSLVKSDSDDYSYVNDAKYKQLYAQQQNFDSQMKTLETKLKEITATLESQEKQLSNNLKDSAPQLSL